MEKKSSIFKPLVFLIIIAGLIMTFNRFDKSMEIITRRNYDMFYLPRQFGFLVFYIMFGALSYFYAKSLDRRSSILYLILLDLVILIYLVLVITWRMNIEIKVGVEIINAVFITLYLNIKYIFILSGITIARLISIRREWAIWKRKICRH